MSTKAFVLLNKLNINSPLLMIGRNILAVEQKSFFNESFYGRVKHFICFHNYERSSKRQYLKLADQQNNFPRSKSLSVGTVVNEKDHNPCNTLLIHNTVPAIILTRCKSTKSAEKTSNETKSLTTAEKLKRAVADYGMTVIVFHVTISLISLGAAYLVISSGVDVGRFLTTIGFSENTVFSGIATNAGTFVAAYALHKVFAPVRISITLAATPFIVRYLRKVGILKILMVQEKYYNFGNLNIFLGPIIKELAIGQNIMEHLVHTNRNIPVFTELSNFNYKTATILITSSIFLKLFHLIRTTGSPNLSGFMRYE